MDKEEALKALALARKYDSEGKTAVALKWANKAASIANLQEALDLVARLEKSGASGKSTSTATPNGSSSSEGVRNRTSTTTNGSASASTSSSSKPEPPKARSFTPEQLEVVKKVRSAGGDFYKVLGVEKGCDEAGCKKAYRKLALQLHPDKNGAPGADEAFKTVSKAFTILTDKDKRAAYDRFGGDPDSRFGTASAAAGPRGPGRTSQFGAGDEIDPRDLFEMFFGGGAGMGGGFGGQTFYFGGPGMQARQFRTQQRPQQRRNGGGGQQQGAGDASILLQFLPLIILALFSLLSYAPSLFTQQDPSYTFAPSGNHREQKFTPKNGVSYYVHKPSFNQHPFVTGDSKSNGGLQGFEKRVENSWKNHLYGDCERVREYQQRRLQNTYGFFGIGADEEAARKIRSEKHESCERLKDFGIYM